MFDFSLFTIFILFVYTLPFGYGLIFKRIIFKGKIIKIITITLDFMGYFF